MLPNRSHPPRYKRLTMFFVGAISLIGSGYLASQERAIGELAVIAWCTFGGTFLIYRINDYIDAEHDFKFNIVGFLREKRHILIVAHLFLIAFPVAFFTISYFRFFVFVCVAAIGLFYSITFSLGKYKFRLKNVLFFKNISVGISWGALVIIGSGNFDHSDIVGLFLFASVQVMIGSMIRDIPDTEKDRLSGARTYPVVFGARSTLKFLHFLNFLSVAIAFFPGTSTGFAMILFGTVLWRGINLWKLTNNTSDRLWGQTLNLLTCFVIFFLALINTIANEFGKH